MGVTPSWAADCMSARYELTSADVNGRLYARAPRFVMSVCAHEVPVDTSQVKSDVYSAVPGVIASAASDSAACW